MYEKLAILFKTEHMSGTQGSSSLTATNGKVGGWWVLAPFLYIVRTVVGCVYAPATWLYRKGFDSRRACCLSTPYFCCLFCSCCCCCGWLRKWCVISYPATLGQRAWNGLVGGQSGSPVCDWMMPDFTCVWTGNDNSPESEVG